jgi:hypothetical protein
MHEKYRTPAGLAMPREYLVTIGCSEVGHPAANETRAYDIVPAAPAEAVVKNARASAGDLPGIAASRSGEAKVRFPPTPAILRAEG